MTINNKINNILALTSHGGGYLNHNKKNYSERRNHGLSLTNLTHCISPSEYYNDYYNNDSFNKINLQLHASSKVSNPYSFSIKSNTGFSGSVQATLPTADTPLFEKADDQYDSIFTDTIPNGVNIIKVIASATGGEFYGSGVNVKNKRTNKSWGFADANPNDYYEHTTYVGVTPGKTYTIIIDGYNDGDNPGYWEFMISYSAEINTHTPDIEDY